MGTLSQGYRHGCRHGMVDIVEQDWGLVHNIQWNLNYGEGDGSATLIMELLAET